MEADDFDEADFFRAIAASGAQILLIGRRALIAVGILTKQFGARPKDLADIDLLKAFAARRAGTGP